MRLAPLNRLTRNGLQHKRKLSNNEEGKAKGPGSNPQPTLNSYRAALLPATRYDASDHAKGEESESAGFGSWSERSRIN